jgi:hypothetical protein
MHDLAKRCTLKIFGVVILYQRLKMMERSIAAIHRWADSQL